MITSHFDTFDAVILGASVFMLAEGLLLVASGKGVMDFVFPRKNLTVRILGALVYFGIAGLFFYSAWRREA